jgi:hypothetical protein
MAGAATIIPLILDGPMELSEYAYLIKTGEVINEGDLVAIDASGLMVVCANGATPLSPLGCAFFGPTPSATALTGDGHVTAAIARRARLRLANSTLVPSLGIGKAVYLGNAPTATVSNYTCVKSVTSGANVNAVGYIDSDGTTVVVGMEPNVLSGSGTSPSRIAVITLCEAFTPAGTGADTAEVTIPGVGLSFTLSSIKLRVNAAGGAPAITIEKSTIAGIFTPTGIGTLTLSGGGYEGNQTAGLGSVNSGDKIRFNVGDLGTATGWTITVEMTT